MKKSIAMKWVKALRSGKYKQARLRLGDAKNGYCCLGVLCKVTGKKHRAQDAEVPPPVREAAGMKTDNGRYLFGEPSLMAHNDGTNFDGSNGKSFAEIADIIEKHWRLL